MGDEVRRTQRGNNNAYCRSGELGWFDWTGLERHADLHRFTKLVIAFRLSRELSGARFAMTLRELLGDEPVEWHGVELDTPDWGEASHSLAAAIGPLPDGVQLHLMVNAYWEVLDFEIPPLGDAYEPWRRCIDTFLAAPDDACRWEDAPAVAMPTYPVQPRSLVMLVARARERAAPRR